MLNNILRYLFFMLVVNPMVLIVIGLNVRRRQLLPKSGPAVVVANHNSHLDALTLMTLFGLRRLKDVHPVAAADYFLRSPTSAWFSTKILGIIPLDRSPKARSGDPLAPVCDALDNGKILILFPEGSRGEPEQLEEFRTGVAHIAKRYPDVPMTPVFMHGLGKVLPRGEGLLVPFFCDVFVGESFKWTNDRKTFMATLRESVESLSAECPRPDWD